MVDSDLDRNTGIDETNEGGGYSDEVGCPSVRSTSVSSDVSDETTTNDEGRFSSDGSERVHGVDNLEHGLQVSASASKKGALCGRLAQLATPEPTTAFRLPKTTCSIGTQLVAGE